METFILQMNSLIPGVVENMNAFLVIFARMMGFVRFAPVLNRKEIPALVKIGLAFLLAIIFLMLLKPKGMPDHGDLLLSIILNLAVGAMIGYMAQLILAAIDAGGDMINMQMGLSSAMVLDPTTSSQVSLLGKFFGIWFPIMAFVCIGFEHSVANMFFIPLGIFLGAEVTWAQFFINNLIPVTLGNIVGAAVFVACAYWFVYLRD